MTTLMKIFIITLILAKMDCQIGSFIMMPFRTFSNEGQLVSETKLRFWLEEIVKRGFHGVTLDFWWRFTEPSPQQYNFTLYHQFMAILGDYNLKLKPILSFHQCGSTIGDECWIPLPDWVLQSDQTIFYRDDKGRHNREYISVFADQQSLSDGRSVLQVYEDFIRAFNSEFSQYYGSQIVDIELGTGPAGQLHYPSYSYPGAFCGVGRFQGSSDLAITQFKEFLREINQQILDEETEQVQFLGTPLVEKENHKPEQEAFFKSRNIFAEECSAARSNKIDCGDYQTKQDECLSRGCCWEEVPGSPYCFKKKKMSVIHYLSDFGSLWNYWYQEQQLLHLQNVLVRARRQLTMKVPLAVKLPCVHWLAGSSSRPAEMTAGFMVHQHNNKNSPTDSDNIDQRSISLLLSSVNSNKQTAPSAYIFSNIWNSSLKSLSQIQEKISQINTYSEIFKVAKSFRSKIVFSCVELTHSDFPEVCNSSPESLMDDFKHFSRNFKVPIIAENTEKLKRTEINSKLEKISNNLPGFFQFNYMRMEDAEGSPSREETPGVERDSASTELVNLLEVNQSSNFYRRKRVVLLETVDCRNCLGELEHFKRNLRIV
jgi:hypothetical protein